MMLQCAAVSDKGMREVNEDSVAVCETENGLLCALADGLGGHGAGEIASRCAVDTARRVFTMPIQPDGEVLARCMQAAQDELMQLQVQQNRRQDMKTTLVLLHITGGKARWAHVGDSRLYLFSGTGLSARTLDHSVPQMLAAQGEIRERDIRFHEDRNRLTRVLGIEWDSPRYELSAELLLAPPQSFLLCSDGFWEYVDEREMVRTLRRSETPDDWLAGMVSMVLQNGKGHNMDNYSAIAVFIR